MIGGNITAEFQIRSTQPNEIGEQIESWLTVQSHIGWVDLQSGNSTYQQYQSKIQESTHIFISDWFKLDDRIKADNCRLMINGQYYDVLLIDNPMELNEQWEIYLKYTGGQNGNRSN